MQPPDPVTRKLEESRREDINVKTKMLDERGWMRCWMLRSSDNIIKERKEEALKERTLDALADAALRACIIALVFAKMASRIQA